MVRFGIVFVALLQGTSSADQTPPANKFVLRLKQEVSMMQRQLVEDGVCLSHEVTVGWKGEVVYRHSAATRVKGDRPISEEALFPIWSMTKPVTSVAAMLLHERGLFALDDSVHAVLPKLSRFRVLGEGGDSAPAPRHHLSRSAVSYD